MTTAMKIIQTCCANGQMGETLNSLNPFKKNNDEDKADTSTRNTASSGGFGLGVGAMKGGKNTKFMNYGWSKLPNKAQKAATTLGYDESNWANSEWAPAEDKDWDDLTDDEKNAATTLGWDAPAWDHQYNNSSWADLPSHVKSAAQVLGFTAEKWDGDEHWSEDLNQWWGDLSTEKQKACNTLGYRAYDWQ